jgi:hypothetical protein
MEGCGLLQKGMPIGPEPAVQGSWQNKTVGSTWMVATVCVET